MVHPTKSIAMTSNKLTDHLIFKNLLIPTWFGKSIEEWTSLQDKLGEFYNETLIRDIVEKLLEIENSPEYWYEVTPWPHPDTGYFRKLCTVIDDHCPPDWSIEIRMFWFAWNLQHIRHLVIQYLRPVYLEKLQQQ
jgi:hypothetical protein